MVQEVEAPSLYPQVREVEAPPGKGHHGYYRKPDGWIVVASTSPSNRSDYEYKGFRFLPRYGQFVYGTHGGQPRERDARGIPWNPADEPWRLFFQKGGAKEFSIEQIIAYRWHLRPPYREIEFPQLKGVEIHDLPCPECDTAFSSTVLSEAVSHLRTHLTSGVNRQHSYSVTDLRELGKEWDIDFETARLGKRKKEIPSLAEEAVSEMVSEMAPVDEPLPVVEMRQRMKKRGRPRK